MATMIAPDIQHTVQGQQFTIPLELIFDIDDTDTMNQYNEAWAKRLIEFLYTDLLMYAVPDDEQRAKLLSEQALYFWFPAFTHVSYNPNDGENYEVLEKLGDPEMEAAFDTFILVDKEMFGITEGQLSSLKGYYLAKKFQSVLSEQLGLPQYVRTTQNLNLSIQEDVLEAVYGAMKLTLMFFLSDQDKSKIIYKFLQGQFINIEIDRSIFYGPPKTQVKEIFEKMNWRRELNTLEEVQVVSLDPQGTVVGLRFNQAFFDWLNKGRLNDYNQFLARIGRGNIQMERPNNATYIFTSNVSGNTLSFTLDMNSPFFARTMGPTQTVAEESAYRDGLKYLDQLGFSWDLTDTFRKSMPPSNPLLQSYHQQLWDKLTMDGFTDYFFNRTLTGHNWRMMQLIGQRSDGYKNILASLRITLTSRNSPSDSLIRLASIITYVNLGRNKQLRQYRYSELNVPYDQDLQADFTRTKYRRYDASRLDTEIGWSLVQLSGQYSDHKGKPGRKEPLVTILMIFLPGSYTDDRSVFAMLKATYQGNGKTEQLLVSQ